MIAGKVEILFSRGFDRERGGHSVDLHKLLVCIFVVSTIKCVDADLMEFDAPDFAEVVSGRKKFQIAAKIYLKQFLGQHEGSDCRKLSASVSIATKSAKYASWALEDIFRNSSYKSFYAIFDTIVSWKFPEI